MYAVPADDVTACFFSSYGMVRPASALVESVRQNADMTVKTLDITIPEPKPKEIIPYLLADPTRTLFQQMLFSKIVPNCKKLGLLDAADGWLRARFTEIGVIQFEDWVDTGEEYAMLDEVAKDRAAADAAAY